MEKVGPLVIALIGIILALTLAYTTLSGEEVPPSVVGLLGTIVAGFLGPPRTSDRQ